MMSEPLTEEERESLPDKLRATLDQVGDQVEAGVAAALEKVRAAVNELAVKVAAATDEE
jgi:hypothetical protein